jgi:hypothetical protein
MLQYVTADDKVLRLALHGLEGVSVEIDDEIRIREGRSVQLREQFGVALRLPPVHIPHSEPTV